MEGYELKALQGASESLWSGIIKAIAFEFGGANIDSGTYFKDFWDLLAVRHNFAFYRILPKRRLSRIYRYNELEE